MDRKGRGVAGEKETSWRDGRTKLKGLDQGWNDAFEMTVSFLPSFLPPFKLKTIKNYGSHQLLLNDLSSANCLTSVSGLTQLWQIISLKCVLDDGNVRNKI